MNSKTKLSILFIVILTVIISLESIDKKPKNTPPDLQPLSDLTGFLSGQAISANDFESNFQCEPDNIKRVPQSENYEVLFLSEDASFETLLSRIDIKDANLRFITFQNQNLPASFNVAPFEFFSNNFELDLNSGGYCCGELSKNSEIKTGIPVLVFSDKEYAICKNPSAEQMLDSLVKLENNGWHLLYLAQHDKVLIPEDKSIDSIWSFPLDSSQDASMVAGDEMDHSIIFSDNFYWYNIVGKTNDPQVGSNSQVQNLKTTFNIVMENMSFGFNEIKVPVGEEITINIENLDSVPHDLFIQSLESGSEIIQGSESSTFKFTINDPGSYDVICNFHPSMQAKIVAE
ncbi:hypothetical protein HOJ01_02020 [bacterium]|jgi:plastocyanin|nr:hypothetical protein [bacterium]MBT6293560.1 hypothetical protein [bacterium]